MRSRIGTAVMARGASGGCMAGRAEARESQGPAERAEQERGELGLRSRACRPCSPRTLPRATRAKPQAGRPPRGRLCSPCASAGHNQEPSPVHTSVVVWSTASVQRRPPPRASLERRGLPARVIWNGSCRRIRCSNRDPTVILAFHSAPRSHHRRSTTQPGAGRQPAPVPVRRLALAGRVTATPRLARHARVRDLDAGHVGRPGARRGGFVLTRSRVRP